MRQTLRIKSNLFNRPEVCGKARCLKVDCTLQEAYERLEKAADDLVKHARWAGYMSTINELRRPLLEIKLAKLKTK